MATMSLTRYNAARPLAKRQASDDEHRRMASSKAKQQRRDSIYHSQEFVREFVKVGWGDHLDSIVLTCTLTLDEMLQIGHLDRSEGTRACLRLVRVPVINDEISSALYIILTEIARPHIPVSINNSPEDILREIREQMKDEIKMLKDYKKQQKLQEKQEKKQSSTTLPQPVCVFCHDHSEEICHIPPAYSVYAQQQLRIAADRRLQQQNNRPGWMFSRRHSTRTVTPTTIERRENFWKQDEAAIMPRSASAEEQRRASASKSSTASPTSSPTTTDEKASPTSKYSFSKEFWLQRKVVKRVNVSGLITHLNDFGESLSYGYGNRV